MRSIAIAVLAIASVSGCGDDDSQEVRRLTVAEAADADDGSAVVSGLLFADAEGLRLCEALAESYPPQCAAAAVPVEEFDVSNIVMQQEGDVAWLDSPVHMTGELRDGVLFADTIGFA